MNKIQYIAHVLLNLKNKHFISFILIIILLFIYNLYFNNDFNQIAQCVPNQAKNPQESLEMFKKLAELDALNPAQTMADIAALPESEREKALLYVKLLRCVHANRYKINNVPDLHKYCHLLLKAFQQAVLKNNKK